jgi:hypothetical protein
MSHISADENVVETRSANLSERNLHSRWSAPPKLREILLLAIVTPAVFASTILLFKNYRDAVESFGDSLAYAEVATAIQHWNFEGLQIKQFWGYSYAIAAVSSLTRLSSVPSLLLVSFISSLVSIVLAYQLWGGWIAAFFCVLNFDWLQRSYLGGSEPLSVALIFAALLAVRHDRRVLAALLAALSTIVRPLGIFCLIAIGLELLYRREYRRFAFAFTMGCFIGAIYVLPFTLHFGDPLATVHSYVGDSRSLFGIPFYAIIEGTIFYPSTVTSIALNLCWIGLVVTGLLMMLRSSRFREYARKYPVEVLFAVPYILLVTCYNYPVFARSNFSRFVIPALPLVFIALYRWIPKDSRVIWTLGIVSPVLAACSAIGIRTVAHLLGAH